MDLKRQTKRYCWKLYIKIVKEQATPEYIARGWAIGMFYGCLIPFGLQLILSIPSAFILKGSKIGATIGTFITNHVTIFFIYPAQCYVGNILMGGNLTFSQVCDSFKDVLNKQSFSALLDIGSNLVIAFFIGGALLTAIMTPITYVLVKLIVKEYQRKRANKKAINAN